MNDVILIPNDYEKALKILDDANIEYECRHSYDAFVRDELEYFMEEAGIPLSCADDIIKQNYLDDIVFDVSDIINAVYNYEMTIEI